MPVEVEGWREFRRDVRRFDKQLARDLQADVRGIAQDVARQASATAPRLTGTMASGYRGTAVGSRGIVRNPVFYAKFIEFGYHPAGSGTFVEGRNVIGSVLERDEERIVDAMGDTVEKTAVKLGWR